MSGCASWIAAPLDKVDCNDGSAVSYPGAIHDLGIPAPVSSSIGGLWTPMSVPFPEDKLFNGDINCDGKVEQATTMIERKTENSVNYVKHSTYAPCTPSNKCATGATSDFDLCYEYVLVMAGPQCGTVPIYISAKNDVTGVCESRQQDVAIVCK